MSDHDEEVDEKDEPVDDDFDDDDDDDDDEFDDDDDDDDDDEFDDDEVGGEGNRVVGGRARAVVEHVASNLVDDVDGLHVDMQERGDGVMLLIHASRGDLGRLIGRRGRVIQALRQVVRAAGASEGVRASVDVVE